MRKRKKIYCYVDETGQDAGSKVFIVVVVVVPDSPDEARGLLLEMENKQESASSNGIKPSIREELLFWKLF